MKEYPSLPTRFLRHAWTAACLGFGVLISPLNWASAAPIEITASVEGQEREFEVSSDEIYVIRTGDRPVQELKDLLESRVAGARIEGYTGTHAIVRLPRAFDHGKAALQTDEISTAVAGAELQPILYPKGTPHSDKTRVFATRDVLVKLPDGKTGQQLATQFGAESATTTLLDAHVMLHFPTAYHALAGAKALRAAGLQSKPQMAKAAQKRVAPPKDRFFGDQWHLFNVGQGGGTPGVDANVLPAWDLGLGRGVNISIVDDGLQTNHPDLQDNTPDIQSNLHHDFNDNDNDPRPGPFDNHGTSVGGVAAARQNNGAPDPVDGSFRGVSGSAPEAKLVGLRLISAAFTDLQSADALYWRPTNFVVSVSNNSWGPTDGSGLHGPDVLTKAALAKATAEGRGGKGQVTVWAGGNGLQFSDDANLDGYANSRFVLAVGAVDNTGIQSYYSEPGANLMVVAPSDGGTLGITTTDRTGVDGYNPTNPGNLSNTDYTNDFGGTSSASPLTAGGVALMLGTNNNLGWRDVKEILASTARQNDPGDPDWVVNDGGFKFSHKYGGGMIDLRAAVTRALTWVNLGAEVTQSISAPAGQVPVQIPDGGQVTRVFDFSAFPNLRLEQIEIVTSITAARRSQLTITLTSPSGVQSILASSHLHPNFTFTGDDDLDFKDNGGGWTFTSTHYWGDNSKKGINGKWTLSIVDQFGGDNITATLNNAAVRLIGTIAPQGRIVFDSPFYSVNEAQVPDPGNPGGFINATQNVRVRRLGPVDTEATVDYQTTVGSATAPGNPGNLPADYVPTSGTLHFSVGQQFADTDIVLEVLDDSTPEPIEQVNVVLNNPVGAVLGGVTLATVDIIDSEQNFVTVVATDNSAAETNNDVPPDTGTFTISRLTAGSDALTVHFNVTGTATYDDFVTANPDYDNFDLVATIPAFEKSVTVVVKPKNDSAIEGVETVILNLESDPAYAIGLASSAQIRIVDNDRQKVQIENLDNLAQENVPTNVGLLRLKRTIDVNAPNAFDAALLVDLSLGGTQRPGTNYTITVGSDLINLGPSTTFFTAVIPAGQTTVDITITPVDDLVYQATKTVIVTLLPNDNYDSTFGFLTMANVRIIEDDPLPDTVIPTVKITSPAVDEKIKKTNAATVIATGVAKDNLGVRSVLVSVNGNSVRAANLTPVPDKPNKFTWDLDITADLVLGKNFMTVTATDGDQFNSNDSEVAVVRFFYLEEHTLTVIIDGDGKVTKAYAAPTIQNAGAVVNIVAKPADGSVFAGWFTDVPVAGTIITTSRALRFMMPVNPPADANLTAKFIPSPFGTEITGNYTGLIQAPFFNTETSGLLTATVDVSGAFTAMMRFSGVQYTFIGEFTAQPGSTATFDGLVPRGNLTPLTVSLSIDTNDTGTRSITGTVNNGAVNSIVVANRAIYSKQNPAPSDLIHDYTFYMPPASPLGNSTKDPHGIGYGTVRINKKGGVTWSGTLPDGSVVTQTTTISKDGKWPLFLSLYNNHGVVLGEVTHSVLAASDFTASVDWFRPTKPRNPLFTAGFKIEDADVIGAIYVAPTSGTRVLTEFDIAPANKGNALINEGNLISTINKEFELTTDNRVLVTPPASPVNLTVKINPVTIAPSQFGFGVPGVKGGTFTGSFFHPIGLVNTPIAGIIFQKAGYQQLIGSFLGTSAPDVPRQTGRVILTPNPPVP